MPGMDGMQICQRIAGIDPKIKRVLMSANADIVLAKSAAHIGVSEVILKPFALGEIKRIVARLMRECVAENQMKPRGIDLLLIGASTGGPDAVEGVLHGLSSDAMPPVAVVQHIASEFVISFAESLAKKSGLKLVFPTAELQIKPGHLYASDGSGHLVFQRKGRIVSAKISGRAEVNGHVPSVDALFNSCTGLKDLEIAAVLLTGMGRDGASGMLALRNAGAMTFCQDQESSVVYGMPREAIALGAANYVGSPQEINEKLNRILLHQLRDAA